MPFSPARRSERIRRSSRWWGRAGGALLASAVVHAALAATVGNVMSRGLRTGSHEQTSSEVDVVITDEDVVAKTPSTGRAPASAPAVTTATLSTPLTSLPARRRGVPNAKQPRSTTPAPAPAFSSPATKPLTEPTSTTRFALSAATDASTFVSAPATTAPVTTADQGREAVTDWSVESAAVSEAEVDVPARLLASGPLVYPLAARQAEIEIDLPLQIVVDTGGRVVSAKGLQRAGYGLDEAATQGIRDYRFSPARRRGRAVPVRMRWTVQFSLR